MTEFIIKEEGIVVGVFQNREDRDSAFDEYFIKQKGRYGNKEER